MITGIFFRCKSLHIIVTATTGGRSAEFLHQGCQKEKTDGVSEELLPEPVIGSNNGSSGLENFVESYNFFSGGISQERFVGLRQSSEGVGQPQDIRYTKQVDLLGI